MLTFEEEGHLYRYNNVVIPSVTQVLDAEGFIDKTHFTEYARDRGSFLHLALKYRHQGILDLSTLDDELVPYAEQFDRFLNASRFTIIECERPVYNKTINIAGTPDLIGKFPDSKGRAYIDVKTGSAFAWHVLQLAGYVLCDTGGVKFPPYTERYILDLKPDRYKLYACTDRADADVFVSACATHHWKLKHGYYDKKVINHEG